MTYKTLADGLPENTSNENFIKNLRRRISINNAHKQLKHTIILQLITNDN